MRGDWPYQRLVEGPFFTADIELSEGSLPYSWSFKGQVSEIKMSFCTRENPKNAMRYLVYAQHHPMSKESPTTSPPVSNGMSPGHVSIVRAYKSPATHLVPR